MEFLNKITLRGVVGRVSRNQYSDKTAVNLNMITEYAYTQPDECQYVEVTWFHVTGWQDKPKCQDLAKVKKDSFIEITGRMKAVKYTDNEGNDRITWNVIAQEVKYIGQRSVDLAPVYQTEKSDDENAKDKITNYYNVIIDVKKEAVEYIKSFLTKRGKNGKFTIDTDVEDTLDPVRILVEVDRHTGDMGYEKVDSIELIENDQIYFETESNNTEINELLTSDIVDVYEYLLYLDNESHWEERNIEIVDGMLKLKEE